MGWRSGYWMVLLEGSWFFRETLHFLIRFRHNFFVPLLHGLLEGGGFAEGGSKWYGDGRHFWRVELDGQVADGTYGG